MNLIRIRDVKDRIYAAFGSYAWAPRSPQAPPPLRREMKWEAVGEGFELKMADLPSVIGAAWDLGTQMAERLKA